MDLLDLVPPEILSMILCSVDSPIDLHSLISASPSCFRVFSLSSEKTLSAMLKNAILPGNLQHALAVLHVPQRTTDFHSAKAATKTFLNEYFDGKSFPFPTDRSSIAALSRLCFQITRFIDDYATKALRDFDAFDPLQGRLLPSTSIRRGLCLDYDSTDTFSPIVLSYTERLRFQRAFFRHELYCKVFPLRQEDFYSDPEPLFPTYFQSDEFVRRITPWEVEEINCVHHYLTYLIAGLIENFEDQAVIDVLCTPDIMKPVAWAASSCQGLEERMSRRIMDTKAIDAVGRAGRAVVWPDTSAWEQRIVSAIFSGPSDSDHGKSNDIRDNEMIGFDDLDLDGLCLFTDYGKSESLELCDYLSSLGTNVVYDLLTSDSENRKDLLFGCYPDDYEFIPKALPYSTTGTAGTMEPEYCGNLYFRSLDGTPFKIQEHDYCYQRSLPCRAHSPQLRARAYKFWDSHRVHTQGIADKLAEACDLDDLTRGVLFDPTCLRSVECRLREIRVHRREYRRIIRKWYPGEFRKDDIYDNA